MLLEKLMADPHISSLCKEQHVRKGQLILRQGEVTPGLFVITSGSCQLYSHIPGEKRPINLAQRKTGEFFGEISFIDQSLVVNNVKALSNMTVTLFPSELLSSLSQLYPDKALAFLEPIVALTGERIRGCVDSMLKERFLLPYLSRPEKLQLGKIKIITKPLENPNLAISNLVQLPLFQLNHHQAIDTLASLFDFVQCKRNQILYQQGDDEQHTYYVISGALQTYIRSKQTYSRLSVVGPSGIVGLVDFFGHRPREVGCMVREDAILLRINWQQIEKLKAIDSILAQKLLVFLNKQITKPFYRFFMHYMQTKSISKLFS